MMSLVSHVALELVPSPPTSARVRLMEGTNWATVWLHYFMRRHRNDEHSLPSSPLTLFISKKLYLVNYTLPPIVSLHIIVHVSMGGNAKSFILEFVWW